MSDDSDLMIAAAATAALFTWMGTRRGGGRATGRARRKRDWTAFVASVRAGVRRTWHECPGYVFITAVRDAFWPRR